ncbi:hypothetical protein J1N35_022802 [Gossypium stocksii]|uniref:Tf2-1-like SH3-like domain-containing protein n=1 Tax=Gossypium stocksii TaxID=47602 RepID=A0A9D3VHW9_9ROSI|nr:hypothetical protein J1N35_022802 [Gossypium stocksii]
MDRKKAKSCDRKSEDRKKAEGCDRKSVDRKKAEYRNCESADREVHMRKERFLNKRKSKLDLRGDEPSQVAKHINKNAYKIDLPSEYNVSSFIVTNLSPFNIAYYKAIPFEEWRNNASIKIQFQEHKCDKHSFPRSPITRFKPNQVIAQLNVLVLEFVTKYLQGSSFEGLNIQDSILRQTWPMDASSEGKPG